MFRGSSLGLPGPRSITGAESVEPLKIPAGLQAPDTRNALKVPELNVPEPPRAQRATRAWMRRRRTRRRPKPVEPEA